MDFPSRAFVFDYSYSIMTDTHLQPFDIGEDGAKRMCISWSWKEYQYIAERDVIKCNQA